MYPWHIHIHTSRHFLSLHNLRAIHSLTRWVEQSVGGKSRTFASVLIQPLSSPSPVSADSYISSASLALSSLGSLGPEPNWFSLVRSSQRSFILQPSLYLVSLRQTTLSWFAFYFLAFTSHSSVLIRNWNLHSERSTKSCPLGMLEVEFYHQISLFGLGQRDICI